MDSSATLPGPTLPDHQNPAIGADRAPRPAQRSRPEEQPEGAALPQLLTVDAGGERYGCPLEAIREIVPGRSTTRLPGAPPHVRGLLNLRGALVTVLDLAVALDGRQPSDDVDGHVLVLEVEGRLAGCRVDHVRRVHPRPPLHPLPASRAGGDAAVGNALPPGIVMGVGEVDGQLLAVMDLRALVRQTLLFPGER